MPTEKRVLVVEDDLAIYPVIRAMIVKLNPQSKIDFAISAEKAAELLLGNSAVRYDVILSDLNLAGQKNGVDLVKEVYFKSGRTPFILASAEKEYVTHLPFLIKPYRFVDFAERMGPYLVDAEAVAPAPRKWIALAGAGAALILAAYLLLR